jgi:hypothetical protein
VELSFTWWVAKKWSITLHTESTSPVWRESTWSAVMDEFSPSTAIAISVGCVRLDVVSVPKNDRLSKSFKGEGKWAGQSIRKTTSADGFETTFQKTKTTIQVRKPLSQGIYL